MLKEDLINIPSTPKDLTQFGLVVGLGFLVLGTIALWFQNSIASYFLIIGLLLALFGLLSPKILKSLQLVWMTLAIIIGFILMHIILTITFYLAITPIGFITRALGKLSFDKNTNPKTSTY